MSKTFSSGPEMKIRIDNGEAIFKKGSIGPKLEKSAFLASTLGTGSDIFVSNEPFVTYRFAPEPDITATASFEGDRLTGITVMMRMPTDDDCSWTEELEIARKRTHDDWLRAELGEPPYRYGWGSIESIFDQRSCISDLIISYSR